MPYRSLTKNGESFIKQACTLNSNNLTGNHDYALGRSILSPIAVFTSNAKYGNVLIKDSATVANLLITWINQYCDKYLLDANIIGAQIYAESSYLFWEYSQPVSAIATSNMGVTQFSDLDIKDLFLVNNRTLVIDPKDQMVFDEQYALITNGLIGDVTDIRNIIPYMNDSEPDTDKIALQNRQQLFQNIIDNPEVMIKNFCRYMSEIGGRNANLAASSLFAYVINPYLTSGSYNEAINSASKSLASIGEGTTYVEKVFKVLGGKFNTKLPSFGKDYEFDPTPDIQANNNLTNALLASQGLNPTPYATTNTVFPKETIFRIVKALNRGGITNKYIQTGILSVISTEGGFEPRSELSYGKTPNKQLRSIFGLRLADQTEAQLTALKANDTLFYEKVYGGQNGNIDNGDGFKFRGRGYNQITFRGTYDSIGKKIGVDLVNNPELLNTVDVAAQALTTYFINFFKIGKSAGILARNFGINDINKVENYIIGTKIAFQANAGWYTNLNTYVLQEEFRKQITNASPIYKIVSGGLV